MCFCSDLLDFVDEGRESLQDIPDEEREPLGSPEFPQLHPAAESAHQSRGHSNMRLVWLKKMCQSLQKMMTPKKN